MSASLNEPDQVCAACPFRVGWDRCTKAVVTPKGRFGSATLAAAAFGLTRQAASWRARNGSCGWRYESQKEAKAA